MKRPFEYLAPLAFAALWAAPSLADAKPRSTRTQSPRPDVSYFMASDPHVPLVVVKGSSFESIATPKHPCGAPVIWAKKGSTWRTLDAWGQWAGELTIVGSDFYDVTRCNEVDFKKATGKAGTGVAVSSGSRYTPPKSAEHVPSKTERAGLERVARATAQLYLSKSELDASEKAPVHAAYFSVPEAHTDGTMKRVTWAVIDGFYFATAHLVEGEWKVVTVRARHDRFSPMNPRRYRLRSIFDMNSDDSPEIVLHFDGGDGFEDVVLAYDRTCGWVEVSDSPGGATA